VQTFLRLLLRRLVRRVPGRPKAGGAPYGGSDDTQCGAWGHAVAPGHTGVDLWADLHLGDVQRLHARAGGLAAGHDELAHAKFDQPARNRGDTALDHGAGCLHAELRLHRFHRIRFGG